jgi:hypothetical protein
MRYRSSSTIIIITKAMCAGVYLDELVLLAKRGEDGGPHLVDVLCGPVGPVQRIRLLIQVVDRDRRRLVKGVCRESIRGVAHIRRKGNEAQEHMKKKQKKRANLSPHPAFTEQLSSLFLLLFL